MCKPDPSPCLTQILTIYNLFGNLQLKTRCASKNENYIFKHMQLLVADKQHTSIGQNLTKSQHPVEKLQHLQALFIDTKKIRLLLEACETKISGSDFLQLGYNTRMIDGLDRYVFAVQL